MDGIPCLRKVWIYLNPRLQTRIPGVKLVFLGIMPILCMVSASLLRQCRAWFPSTSQAGEGCWDEILPHYGSISFWVWDKTHQLHTILTGWIRHRGNRDLRPSSSSMSRVQSPEPRAFPFHPTLETFVLLGMIPRSQIQPQGSPIPDSP